MNSRNSLGALPGINKHLVFPKSNYRPAESA